MRMLFALPDHETLYRALLERDPAHDGLVYAGMTGTGVFCRFGCPAPKPALDGVRFFESVAGCFEAGFRPCLRCRPLEPSGRREPVVSALLHLLEDDPGKPWSDGELRTLGYEPLAVRRAFVRHLGLSFLDIARLRRTGRETTR